jgi:hypothetical protein
LNRSRIFNCVSIVSLLTLAIFSACAAAPKEIQPEQSTAPAAKSTPGSSTIAVGHDSSGASTSAPSAAGSQGSGPVKWTPPSRWEAKPASGMRAATYIIPPASGDSEGGECAVFENLGGTVQANVDRWIGQFEKTDGAPNQKSETISGLSVTTVDVSGIFKGGGPMMGQGQSGAPKSGYRLLGAIVEGPEGNVFFKLTGPAKTIAAAQDEFQAMLKSLKK